MMRRCAVLLFLPMLAAGPAFAADYTIGQRGMNFTPSTLRISKGDKLIFINDDDRTHNVYSTSEGNQFDLKAQRPGAKGEIVLANPGTVEIRCAIHPHMKLTVVVE